MSTASSCVKGGNINNASRHASSVTKIQTRSFGSCMDASIATGGLQRVNGQTYKSKLPQLTILLKGEERLREFSVLLKY